MKTMHRCAELLKECLCSICHCTGSMADKSTAHVCRLHYLQSTTIFCCFTGVSLTTEALHTLTTPAPSATFELHLLFNTGEISTNPKAEC